MNLHRGDEKERVKRRGYTASCSFWPKTRPAESAKMEQKWTKTTPAESAKMEHKWTKTRRAESAKIFMIF
jgi:hypothetical protein